MESPTENATAVEGLLEDLKSRGLRYTQGLLCIVDGQKGLHKGIKKALGPYVVLQRCCLHKRESVAGKFIAEADKEWCRKRMKHIYDQPDYASANEALDTFLAELEQINPRAAASLREGREETLTVHRLAARG